jgi:hypothetical protein
VKFLLGMVVHMIVVLLMRGTVVLLNHITLLEALISQPRLKLYDMSEEEIAAYMAGYYESAFAQKEW